MIDLRQLEVEVIIPTMRALDLWSPRGNELVLLTGWVESRYKYIRQVGGGPARSFWQVEPVTMFDTYENYLFYRKDLKEKVDSLIGGNHAGIDLERQLTVNMAFGAAMCRLKYRRSSMPLPIVGDTQGQAHIWKKVYNTAQGAGTEEKFIKLADELKGLM